MNKLNKSIKICFIAPKAYPLFNPNQEGVFGGAEVDLYYLSTELAKDEHFKVSFITADYGQEKEQTIENVRIIKSLTFKENPLAAAVKIWRALKRVDAGAYMIKTYSLGMFLVALFCRVHKRIFLYRSASQSEGDGSYLKRHRLVGWFSKVALRKAEVVFVQNIRDQKNFMKTMAVQSVPIPNAHRLAGLSEQTRDSIIWVGRSVEVKRPELFLQLAEQFPQEKFIMICQRATGDENYENLVNQADKIKNLRFIQRVPFNEIDGYFRRSKIFVNTSEAEGFPNTFIQACIAGTPILSLNVNPDGFLDEFHCGIYADDKWQKLIDSLASLLENERYIELGRNARKYVEEKHDIVKIVETYKTIFENLMKAEISRDH